MVTVVHYDYIWDGESNLHQKLEDALDSHERMDYYPIFNEGESASMGINSALLEVRRRKADVFLVHPGVHNQRKVFFDVPRDFPDLRVGLVCPDPWEYPGSKKERVRVLSYDNLQGILEFILGEE
jgi:hypothetical protein